MDHVCKRCLLHILHTWSIIEDIYYWDEDIFLSAQRPPSFDFYVVVSRRQQQLHMTMTHSGMLGLGKVAQISTYKNSLSHHLE